MTSNEWRPILAALANENARLALAEIVLAEAAAKGTNLTDAQRGKAHRALFGASLICDSGGTLEVDTANLRSVLATPDGGEQQRGNERFMHNGRIDRYPANQTQRHEFLRWISGQVLQVGEVLDELSFNDRLGQLSDNFALLRRYLVDAGLVARTPSGTAYWLVNSNIDDGGDADGKVRG